MVGVWVRTLHKYKLVSFAPLGLTYIKPPKEKRPIRASLGIGLSFKHQQLIQTAKESSLFYTRQFYIQRQILMHRVLP